MGAVFEGRELCSDAFKDGLVTKRLLHNLLTKPLCTVVHHRRRIKTEEKAKVVVAVWGTELIQFIATLALFTRMI